MSKFQQSIEELVEAVSDITDGNNEKALKMLTMVMLDFMIKADAFNFEIGIGDVIVEVDAREK